MVKKNDYLIIGAVILVLAFATGMISLGGTGATGGGNSNNGGGNAAASCPTIVTQTLSNVTYDFDRQTTAVSNTATVYLSAANGVPYAQGLSTQQIGTYDVLMTATNYFGTIVHTTTSCSATPAAIGYLKGVDTPTAALYDANQITLNTATPLAVGASLSGVAHLKLSQAAAYKHLVGESGKFCVFVNVANVSEWSSSDTSIVFNGQPCVAIGSAGLANAEIPAAASTGTNLKGVVCSGVDFGANDGTIYDMAIKMQAASGVNPAATNNTIYYGGADYYKDATTGKVGVGCSTEAKVAIQTLRTMNLEVS